MKRYILIFCSVVVIYAAPAQKKPQFYERQIASYSLTGAMDIDLCTNLCLSSQTINFDSSEIDKTYSPALAGLLSVAVPGAGQFYTDSYWQSMAFIGVEVSSWIIYAAYNSKGNKQTNDFQNFADQRWSVVRYVQWIGSNFGFGTFGDPTISGTSGLPPWQQVDWDKLNEIEDWIGAKILSGTITGFTHRLPHRPEQQYYELIGKYPQFGGGWDDAAYFTTEDATGKGNVSPDFLSYAKMRGDANTFYAIASTATYVILANHILNALEAAWNASRINKKIAMHASLQPTSRIGYVEYVPTVSIALDLQ